MPLVLLRHGQTAANRDRLLLGRNDPALTDLGLSQASAAASAIGRPDRVVSSPLLRARQTAAAFGDDVAVEVDERWLEIDYGHYDGRPLASVPDEVWSAWRADERYAPPDGESLTSVQQRVGAACDALVDTAAGGMVVVVSHVTPIKAAVAWALGVGPSATWRLFLDLASITIVDVGARGPVLRSYNGTGHLGL